MIPWKQLAEGKVPDLFYRSGQGREISPRSPLVLWQRGDEFSIRVDNWELMNSRSFTSEREIAIAALSQLGFTEGGDRPNAKPRSVEPLGAKPPGAARPPRPCVLIGGLGMGFTLRAALEYLPANARVIVAELVPDVVTWNEKYLGHLADNPLSDPRIQVFLGDAAERIRDTQDVHDAIILDVDNGPHTKQTASEGWLYSDGGLNMIRKSLRPGGVLSIWSAGPADGFSKRMERCGFEVDERVCLGRGNKGHRYRIWLGTRHD